MVNNNLGIRDGMWDTSIDKTQNRNQASNQIQNPNGILNNNQNENRIDKSSDSSKVDKNECQTCSSRRYQDGSDDPGVSFKSPGHIAPDQSFSAVTSHEGEHVVRERAKAKQEGNEVISQSVSVYSAVCPECGKVYSPGGETRTVVKIKNDQDDMEKQKEQEKSVEIFKGNSINAIV